MNLVEYCNQKPHQVVSILAVLVALIAILRIVSAYPNISQAYDEPAHIACGLEYVANHVYKLETQHPPLTRAMIALLPYLSALGEKNLENEQMSRVQSEFNSKTGLYGNPAKYYDQNLVLFALGWKSRQFWFDSQGRLNMQWHSNP